MTNEHAHQLLDQLDPGQFAAVSHLLEVMAEPISRLQASLSHDDEPVTDQDLQRFRQGQAWFASRGKGVPMEEVIAAAGIHPGWPALPALVRFTRSD